MYCGSCLEVLERNPIMFRYMFFQLITGYNTRLTLTLDMSLQKTSIGKNIIPLLGPKIWDKIYSFIWGVKTKPSVNHLWEREVRKEVTVERSFCSLFSVNTTL